ncbi:flagellar biosynthesis protein FlgB [Sphingomonas parva]|uniref:Flagellar biosynthesis protein FlgB n=2 Tax=Sphingomonas parva TaxID=2555898 RepID=A0A4Y8ZUG6_9SPHN|nr:flagellar basal body protein [Sphingomonas parva]TFI59651.1 flagellar biosynthesis protein FlgB [Sphingomonas parva]
MQHMSGRQKVIAQNIANSETPGFKAREVEAPDFSQMLGAMEGGPRVVRPRVTISGGMAALGARPTSGANGVILDKDTMETKPDGNNVTLEEQLLKMGQVQADFTALTSLYKKQLLLMKTATR